LTIALSFAVADPRPAIKPKSSYRSPTGLRAKSKPGFCLEP
jgi:hypothetical protein